jgi:hypothetical protein
MKILRFDESDAEDIGPRPFAVQGVSGVHVGEGGGEAHAYVMHFGPGGLIGPHEARFGQLFVALDGSGWVAGADGEREHSSEAKPPSSREEKFIPKGATVA